MCHTDRGHSRPPLLADLILGFPATSQPWTIKLVPEVCRVFCATANPVQVVVAETEQGRGILGVIDGAGPLGEESDEDVAERRALLRTIGYKL